MYIAVYALINGYMIAFYAAMPFWYIVHFHMREDRYAWLAFIPITTYIIGSSIANFLLSRISMERVLLLGILLALLVGPAAFLIAPFASPSIISITALVSLFSIASGIVTPMSNASVMHRFRDKVTTVSALISGTRVGGAGLLVLISANIHLDNYLEFASYTTGVALVALTLYVVFKQFDPGVVQESEA